VPGFWSFVQIRASSPAARSATASGALACQAMSSLMPLAAQAWSNTVRIPVPSGMHMIGYALMSARVAARCFGQVLADVRDLWPSTPGDVTQDWMA
jgi:hypothetical protein